MSLTLAEIARLVGGQVIGEAELVILGAATIDAAAPGEITLADHAKLAPKLAQSAASAAIVPQDFRPEGISLVVVDNVREAFARIVTHFRPPRVAHRIGVSSRAHVSPTAKLGRDVDIHPGATVGQDVEIGDGATIHSGAHLMAGCKIGAGAVIFPGATLYEETVVGERSVIHANAVIGAYGFGYEMVEGRHVRTSQLGYVQIGSDVEIGAGTMIDRGSYGPTVIGDGTKIDNLVQIGHNCRIGRHNLLCSQVGIAGSTSTGDYVVMAGQVGVRDHVHIGDCARIGAQSGVKDSLEAHGVYLGTPAHPERLQVVLYAAVAKLPETRKQLRELQRRCEALEARLEEKRKAA